jgi:3-oxoacyl-(acyl-carrier-protein) synthase
MGSRTAQLAFTAVDEALEESGRPDRDDDVRMGVCVGTTVDCQLNDLPFYQEYRDSSQPDLDPVCRYVKTNLAEVVAEHIGAMGPRATVVNACSSSADAIGMAMDWLRADLCDAVVAGGADELNRVPICGFNSLGIVSEDSCRPFDRDRDGLNLGEGAGMIIIEKAESARRRNTESELRLSGFGAACDAHHVTAPDPEGVGLKLALQEALKIAEADPSDVAFVNAHGTATPANDRVEGNVLAEIFGDRTHVLSTKGYTGHTLGAAGGVEAVFTAMALRDGWLPPSRGFQNQDSDIPLKPVTERTSVEGDLAISTSLAFGGNNAVVAMENCS